MIKIGLLVSLVASAMASSLAAASNPFQMLRQIVAMDDGDWTGKAHAPCMPTRTTFTTLAGSAECKAFGEKMGRSDWDSLNFKQQGDLICVETACMSKIIEMFSAAKTSSACTTWLGSATTTNAQLIAAGTDLSIGALFSFWCTQRSPDVRCVDMFETFTDPTKNDLSKHCGAVSDATNKLCCQFASLGCCWGSLANILAPQSADLKTAVNTIDTTCAGPHQVSTKNVCPDPFKPHVYLLASFKLTGFDYTASKSQSLDGDVATWLGLNSGMMINPVPVATRSGETTVNVQALADTGADTLETKMKVTPAISAGSGTLVANSLTAPQRVTSTPVGSSTRASVSVAMLLAIASLF